MSLSSALNSALSGLRVSQAALALTATNVANADTPGYVRKTQDQTTTPAGQSGLGVRIASVNRELDVYLQRQLRTELSGGGYTDVRARFYDRLQQVYGEPGSTSAIETAFNSFTAALQALQASPESQPSRSSLLSAAQLLAQRLNGTSADIQGLRSEAELGLADSVRSANEAIQEIVRLNLKINGSGTMDAAGAVLLDQRDAAIDKLSQLMDIRVSRDGNNQVTVFTTSGIQLVGMQASELTFDAAPAVTPGSQWDADPTQRTLGTVSLKLPNGGALDLVAAKAFRSGKIAALLEMRDAVLPQAQAQLDQIAAGMASALSDQTTQGTAVAGPPTGFDLDTAGLLPGNRIQLAYTDNVTGTQHKITIVRVDDPAALPLPATATSDPNDTVVGIDFSGGMASVVTQLNTALGATTNMVFSNPAGATLRVVDDGAPDLVDVNSASITKTVTALAGGSAELPFFTDGIDFYSGEITSAGLQSTGLSGRLVVNPALIADPSRLVVYQISPQTPAGDQTRPDFIYDRLTSATMQFSPQGGIGTVASPFSGSLPSYLRQMISQQGDAAASAQSLKQGQDIVVNQLEQRFNDSSGVNIDAEMSNLLKLQTAYSANARVVATVKDMFDLLMRM